MDRAGRLPGAAPAQPRAARGARPAARAPARARRASPRRPLLPAVFIRGRRAEAEASSSAPAASAAAARAVAAAAASCLLAAGEKEDAREPARASPPSLTPQP